MLKYGRIVTALWLMALVCHGELRAQEKVQVISKEVGFYTSMVGAITGIVGEEISKADEGQNPLALLAKIREQEKADSIRQDSVDRAAALAKMDTIAADSTETGGIAPPDVVEKALYAMTDPDTEAPEQESEESALEPVSEEESVEASMEAEASDAGVTYKDGKYVVQIGAFKYRPYAERRQQEYGGEVIEEDGYLKVIKYFDTLEEAVAEKDKVEGDSPFMRHDK